MAQPDPTDVDALALRFAQIAVAAGVRVLEVYARPARARLKADQSPVTEADEAAEALILAALPQAAPGVPVVSEEAVCRAGAPEVGGEFILVDPLDGTREFIAGNHEFTVNIALVRNGVPVAGALYAPALERLWFAGTRAFEIAVAPGAALPPRASWRALRTRQPPVARLALISRSHLDARTLAFLDNLGVDDRRPVGSSLKLGLIASGEADLAPRFGPTMAWDIAAGDAILRAAGGAILRDDGGLMRYGEGQNFCNTGFVAWGRNPTGNLPGA